MSLNVGEPAPPFVLPASTGQDISLQALTGKTVILYFYPRDDTPFYKSSLMVSRYGTQCLSTTGALRTDHSVRATMVHASQLPERP